MAKRDIISCPFFIIIIIAVLLFEMYETKSYRMRSDVAHAHTHSQFNISFTHSFFVFLFIFKEVQVFVLVSCIDHQHEVSNHMRNLSKCTQFIICFSHRMHISLATCSPIFRICFNHFKSASLHCVAQISIESSQIRSFIDDKIYSRNICVS